MKKTEQIFWTIFILCAVTIALCGKIHVLGRLLMVPELIYKEPDAPYLYGDLYRFSHVSKFKEQMPNPPHKYPIHKIDECDIFVIGDSFFEALIDGDNFASKLEKKLNKYIYNITLTDPRPVSHPLEFFETIKYQKGKSKILILESVERVVTEGTISSYMVIDSPLKRTLKNIRGEADNIILPKDINFFMDNNIFFEPLIRFKADFYFSVFNQINELTPIYSSDPPMLFYKDEVDFSKQVKSEESIKNMAEKLAIFRDTLLEKYNIQLIYVLVPTKLTIYADLLHGEYDYDNYIPHVVDKLKAKNIIAFDSYAKMMATKKKYQPELIYFISDTHYNSKGRMVLVDECANLVDSLIQK